MGLRNVALFAGVMLAVGACVPDPKSFETEPVVIDTSAGPVTCQLYTAEIVSWDRAIDRPQGMSVTAADDICQNEGRRQALRQRAAP